MVRFVFSLGKAVIVLIAMTVSLLSYSQDKEAESKTGSVPARRRLDEAAFLQWTSIRSNIISPDGRWVSYEQYNKNGLQRIVIYGPQGQNDTINNARAMQFSDSADYACYTVAVPPEGNSTKFLRNLKTGKARFFPGSKEMRFIAGGRLLVVRNSREKNLSDLYFYNLKTEDSLVFDNIASYKLSNTGKKLLLSRKTATGFRLELFDFKLGSFSKFTGNTDFRFGYAGFSPGFTKAAIVKRRENRPATLGIFDLITMEETDSLMLPDGFASFSPPFVFNMGEDLLSFVMEKKIEEPKGTNQPPKIWRWDEPRLPVSRSPRYEVLTKETFCTYNFETDEFRILSDAGMPDVEMPGNEGGTIALGFNRYEYSIDEDYLGSPRYRVYIVDIKTGNREMILDSLFCKPSISYDKQYIGWFETADSSWYVMNTLTGDRRNVSKGIDDYFYDPCIDKPSNINYFGAAGWSRGGHEFLINSRYDIWSVDAAGEREPLCITGGEGRRNEIVFRYAAADNNTKYIDSGEPLYLSAFGSQNKKSGYFIYRPDSRGLEKLIFEDCRFSFLRFSDDRQTCIWKRETFTDCPEIYKSAGDFSGIEKLSDSNPQQKDYIWGTAELVAWKTGTGQVLSGILYKPEDYDPQKKYPMIVSSYEKESDELHVYHRPQPFNDVVNRSYCTGNGYFIFIPDVSFRVGEPGASALEAVVSGVGYVKEKYPCIDRTGINGHSWGAYQASYIISRTDIFDAAVVCAPVSDMISGYAGIRREVGISRMFQYEKGQSRIGKTLWDAPEAYIKNSPLFHAPDIRTPLLIQSNESDGAVPWEQGIELFMALRRLKKPVWMLDYPKEGHSIYNWENSLDFTRKTMSFFDYYLKPGSPPPDWM